MQPEPSTNNRTINELFEFRQVSNHKLADSTVEYYMNSLRACGISEIDVSNPAAIWKYLLGKLDGGTSYAFVKGAMSAIRGLLKIHGIAYTRDLNFNMLNAKINNGHRRPPPYSLDELSTLVNTLEGMANENGNEGIYGLRNCLLLGFYSGLRISSIEDLCWGDFLPSKVENVRTFRVKSKGRKYISAISEGVFQRMLANRQSEDEHLVVCNKPNFSKLQRAKLDYLLKKCLLKELVFDKSPFHSARKAFLTFVSTNLTSEEIGLLAGHAPPTVAYKSYILKEGKDYPEESREKIAAIYAKTGLLEVVI